jgi:hypothetical protein
MIGGFNYLEACVHDAVAYPRLSAPRETAVDMINVGHGCRDKNWACCRTDGAA